MKNNGKNDDGESIAGKNILDHQSDVIVDFYSKFDALHKINLGWDWDKSTEGELLCEVFLCCNLHIHRLNLTYVCVDFSGFLSYTNE